MFFYIWMIGRALKRDIDRDFEAMFLFGDFNKMLKILDCSELGVNRFVSADFGADCPWAAGIVSVCGEFVVFSFAESFSDRMDRREVNDIETHFCNPRELTFRLAECSVFARFRTERAGEKLIPCASSSQNRFDHDFEFALVF